MATQSTPWISTASTLIRKILPGTYENIERNDRKILETYKTKERLKDVYASMTTYAPRIDHFEYSILSILRGSVLPERILVYVPKGFIEKLKQKGNSMLSPVYDEGYVRLIEMEEDVYCHSKYYYSFMEYGKDKNIVLFDDDVVYYRNWLKQIYEAAMAHPEFNVFAYKTIEVTQKDGNIEPYDNWVHCNRIRTGNGKLLFAEAFGGVFYRKGSMNGETLNKDAFLDLVPKADDVWLWFCSCLNGNKIKYVSPRNNVKLQFIIPKSQEVALWKDNTIAKRNDLYVQKCSEYFLNKHGLDIKSCKNG